VNALAAPSVHGAELRGLLVGRGLRSRWVEARLVDVHVLAHLTLCVHLPSRHACKSTKAHGGPEHDAEAEPNWQAE
jgi:hypothetical protein